MSAGGGLSDGSMSIVYGGPQIDDFLIEWHERSLIRPKSAHA